MRDRHRVHCVWQKSLKKSWGKKKKKHEKYNLQLLETRVEIKDRIWSPLAGLSQRCTPEAALAPGAGNSKIQSRQSCSLSAHWGHLPAAGDCGLKDSQDLHLTSPHMLPELQELALQQEETFQLTWGPSLKEQSLSVLKVWQRGLNIPDVTSRPDRIPYKQSPLHIKKALKHQSESSLAKLKNIFPNPKNKRISNVWDSQILDIYNTELVKTTKNKFAIKSTSCLGNQSSSGVFCRAF